MYYVYDANGCRAQGILTDEMKIVAKKESMAPDVLMERMAKGTIIIPRNKTITVWIRKESGRGFAQRSMSI